MLLPLSTLTNVADNMARPIKKKSGTGIYHVMLRAHQDRPRELPDLCL